MIIGIDLGTTNSEVCVVRDGKLDVISIDGSPMLPSCVGLSAAGEMLIGQAARNQYAWRPEQTIRSIKRKMGTEDVVALGDKTYRPQEISAMILRELKNRASQALGRDVTQAVITVPAYFNDAQRQATREAGALAGLEVLRILNEPTAAALAYEAAGVSKRRNVLVYDFGGGTFDVSIVTMTGDVVEVRATHGDNHLGGDDIDALLLERALATFQEQHGQRPGTIGESRLRMACEQLKKDLSSQAMASLSEVGIPLENGDTVTFSMDMNRSEFEDITQALIRRTLTSIRHVMTESGLHAGDIDEILLVGGSTRIPAIEELIEREIGKRPRRDVNPDLAVAYGAGVMAARLAGSNDQRILVDISPYTFGTSCLGFVDGEHCQHQFVPIIKSGTPLPARRGKVFYTAIPGQTAVNVRIFQGDNQDARRNVLVGDFMVEDLDEGADQGSEILLNMALDLDGILTATAIEQHTGLNKSVVIEDSLKKVSEADLEQSRSRIAEMFPDVELADGDDDGDVSDADEVHPGDADLLARIDRCREHLDAVDAEDLDRLLEKLREARRASNETAEAQTLEGIEDILFFAEQRT
ncbi:MAG TPA: heat-shock protein Hsp70 [Verrucomicrobia bacterium]|nr:heat-shock protein Hsp70 [Verrucomicrobiota bacterium]